MVFQVLEAGKTLMVPTPRLSQGLFNRLEPDPEDSSKDRLRQLASRHGIDNLSKPIPMASRIKLDMVVIGSVAVDRLGHRIGKGEGRSLWMRFLLRSGTVNNRPVYLLLISSSTFDSKKRNIRKAKALIILERSYFADLFALFYL